MNNDYISREAVLLAITNNESTTKKIANILNIPAADVTPVVHSKWFELIEFIEDGYTGEYYEEIYYNCFNCDFATSDKTPYCPNCGAKMDGE